jgi:hypothetical protein
MYTVKDWALPEVAMILLLTEVDRSDSAVKVSSRLSHCSAYFYNKNDCGMRTVEKLYRQ